MRKIVKHREHNRIEQKGDVGGPYRQKTGGETQESRPSKQTKDITKTKQKT